MELGPDRADHPGTGEWVGLANQRGARPHYWRAGAAAGPGERRYVAAVIVGGLMLGNALLAGLLQALSREYVTALVGLAILRVVADGFHRVFSGPLRLAPLATFVVAPGSFTVVGIGPTVWTLVAGLAVVVELPDLWTFWHEVATPR